MDIDIEDRYYPISSRESSKPASKGQWLKAGIIWLGACYLALLYASTLRDFRAASAFALYLWGNKVERARNEVLPEQEDEDESPGVDYFVFSEAFEQLALLANVSASADGETFAMRSPMLEFNLTAELNVLTSVREILDCPNQTREVMEELQRVNRQTQRILEIWQDPERWGQIRETAREQEEAMAASFANTSSGNLSSAALANMVEMTMKDPQALQQLQQILQQKLANDPEKMQDILLQSKQMSKDPAFLAQAKKMIENPQSAGWLKQLQSDPQMMARLQQMSKDPAAVASMKQVLAAAGAVVPTATPQPSTPPKSTSKGGKKAKGKKR